MLTTAMRWCLQSRRAGLTPVTDALGPARRPVGVARAARVPDPTRELGLTVALPRRCSARDRACINTRAVPGAVDEHTGHGVPRPQPRSRLDRTARGRRSVVAVQVLRRSALLLLAGLLGLLAGLATGFDPALPAAAVAPLAGPAPAAAPAPAPGPGPALSAPLAGPLQITRRFAPPASAYGAGHRGVDLAGTPGAAVLAAGGGVVSYAGVLAGRGVVAVRHGGDAGAPDLETTYEPLGPLTVRRGDVVPRGATLGRLARGHPGCPVAACLHWGLLRRPGPDYLDPLLLLGLGPVRLLPLDGQPGGP